MIFYLFEKGEVSKQMKVLVCDDEKLFLNKISQDLRCIGQELDINFSLILSRSEKEFWDIYKKDPDIDIVFMDILLGNENGYQIASRLREANRKIKIIFLTAITKYAIKGYEIGATRYLVKPITFKALKSVFSKTVEEVIKSSEEYIIEKNDEGVFKIFLSDIIYIETYERNTLIHTKEKKIISYHTMLKHLSRLNSKFVRCHIGVIVNIEYVMEFGRNSLTMQYGKVVPMSKSKKNGVKEALLAYYDNLIINK